MPEENQQTPQEEQETQETKRPNPWVQRILIIGGILLILGVEIGISYMLNKNVVVPKYFSQEQQQEKQTEEKVESGEPDEAEADELNQNIYMLENIVINPVGTNGGRYVALAVGFGVRNPETLSVLETRDIQIRDAINSLLSNKSLREFVDVSRRDSLKQEIMTTVNGKIEPKQVESVYFTEYVIQ